MARPFQQQALQRKLIYLGLVVVLFSASWVWRRSVVEAHAREHGLREQDVGDVEVAGSAVRLSLSGLRGFAMTTLWYTAIEKKERHQWNELELVIQAITKLQPHFITPWQFQGWNLAYNVSVESDRIRDKYFYVTRGVQLLAEGEKKNRYRPELRRDIGMFQEHKIMKSDENNVMRSLFQLSCIPPKDRRPYLFWQAERRQEAGREVYVYQRTGKGKAAIKWEEYKKFCLAHPQLIRRLYSPPLVSDPRREHPKFACEDAEQVVTFLKDNYDIPSLWVTKEEDSDGFEIRAPKENRLERFPILPELPNDYVRTFTDYDTVELTADNVVTISVEGRDALDAFQIARSWYSYAVEALPPPDPEMPFKNSPIPYEQRRFKRVPKHMQTVLYRSTPARTQTSIAERLEEEGWFGIVDPYATEGEMAEKVNAWKLVVQEYKPDGQNAAEWILQSKSRESSPKVLSTSEEAWRAANLMWNAFGERNHLVVDDTRQNRYQTLADEFSGRGRRLDDKMDASGNFEDAHLREMARAAEFIRDQASVLQTTNFNYFKVKTEVEQESNTLLAKKKFYRAERARRARNKPEVALKLFEDAAADFRKVLDVNDETHRAYRREGATQEFIFTIELKYVQTYADQYGTVLKQHLALQSLLAQSMGGASGSEWALLSLYVDAKRMPTLTVVGPFGEDPSGKPYFTTGTRERILSTLRLTPKAAQTSQGSTGLQ